MPFSAAAATAAKSLQSCPTLCDPMDCSLPGFSVHGILQARTLEWVAISFSNAWKWKVKVKLLSRVWLFATPWTAAYQAPPSMGFSRQEYWSGVPLLLPSLDSQLCPTLRDPMDCSPPGSSTHGIFQARGLEWGATAFSQSCPSSPHWRCDYFPCDKLFSSVSILNYHLEGMECCKIGHCTIRY